MRSLRAFQLAAPHLSFKLAAEELFLTPSAVSHQIKILESFMGIDLFIRRSRALELTGPGKLRLTGLLCTLSPSHKKTARRRFIYLMAGWKVAERDRLAPSMVLTLRAYSLRSYVQTGCPAGLSTPRQAALDGVALHPLPQP